VTPENRLTLEAARLARSAPGNWERFLGALQAYSSQSVTNCIQSPLDELPRAQGRAQATARLYGILSDCLASADKLEGKSK
jgi:hypothetical protein